MSQPLYENTTEASYTVAALVAGGELALRNSIVAEVLTPEVQLSPEDEVRRDILILSRDATVAIAQRILANGEPDWHAHLMADSLLNVAEGFATLGLKGEAIKSIHVYGDVMKQAPQGDAYRGLQDGLRVAEIYEQIGEAAEASRLYDIAAWGARHLLGRREINSKEAETIIGMVSKRFVNRGDAERAREIITEPIDQYEKKHLQDPDSYNYSERVTSQLLGLALYQAKNDYEPGAVRETVEAALEVSRTVNIERIGYEPSFIKNSYIQTAEVYLAIGDVVAAASALGAIQELDDYGADIKIAERVVQAAAQSHDEGAIEVVLGILPGNEARLRGIALRIVGVDDDGARALAVAHHSSKPEIAVDMLTRVYDMAITENPSVANESANRAVEMAQDMLQGEHDTEVGKKIVRSMWRIAENQTAESREVVGEALGLLSEVLSTYDVHGQYVQKFVCAAIKYGDADLAMKFVRSVLPGPDEASSSSQINVATIKLILEVGEVNYARELLPYITGSDASVYGAQIVSVD